MKMNLRAIERASDFKSFILFNFMKCIEAKFQKLWVRESPKYFQEYLIGGHILKCFKTLFLDKSLTEF